jgi:large repetitive protein
VYTHDGSETTEDHFTYVANDGVHDSSVATVTVTIKPVNDPPVAVNDTITVSSGGSTNIPSQSLLGNDHDPEGNTLAIMVITNPTHGVLTKNVNGSFTYTHDGSDATRDSFTYRVSDGQAQSDEATVTLLVKAPEAAPPSKLFLPLVRR